MRSRRRRRLEARRREHARQQSRHTRHSLITGAALSAGAVLGMSSAADAATFQVDNTGDNPSLFACTGAADDCSLRGALGDTNSNGNPGSIDYITFASNVTGTITLTGGQLPISQSVYILGPGANVLTVSGNNASRIFNVDMIGPLGRPNAIYYLTMANGNAANGGAVFNENATLKIAESTLTGNTATGKGGAVYDHGGESVTYGGNSNIIYASTISGNVAGTLGGGVFGYRSIGSVDTSTITGNHGGTGLGEDGGGIYSSATGYVTDSTIAGNGPAEAGGGVASASAMTITNSILADNTALVSPDFYSFSYGTSTASFSLIEDGAAVAPGPGPNIIGRDPQLGPLQNNGGTTPTMRPAASSPVVDQGKNVFARDQRFMTRTVDNALVPNAPGGNATDIGAVELSLSEGPQVTPMGAPPPPKKKCKKKKGKSGAQSSKKKCKKKKKKKG